LPAMRSVEYQLSIYTVYYVANVYQHNSFSIFTVFKGSTIIVRYDNTGMFPVL
jgi:hypothetical protein